MDEIEANRFVSAAAVLILIITTLFIFSISRTEVSVSESKSGWIAASSGGNTSASLSQSNSTYEISNDPGTNSTTVAGIVEESFTASRGSSNLTYAMHLLFVSMGTYYSVDVYTRAALNSELPITTEEFLYHVPPYFWGFEFEPMNSTIPFNDTYSDQYTFTMEWTLLLTFTNATPFEARFFCNISFSMVMPNIVMVNIPNSLGFDSFVAVAIGVVVISMAVRTWNQPKVVDDSKE